MPHCPFLLLFIFYCHTILQCICKYIPTYIHIMHVSLIFFFCILQQIKTTFFLCHTFYIYFSHFRVKRFCCNIVLLCFKYFIRYFCFASNFFLLRMCTLVGCCCCYCCQRWCKCSCLSFEEVLCQFTWSIQWLAGCLPACLTDAWACRAAPASCGLAIDSRAVKCPF